MVYSSLPLSHWRFQYPFRLLATQTWPPSRRSARSVTAGIAEVDPCRSNGRWLSALGNREPSLCQSQPSALQAVTGDPAWPCWQLLQAVSQHLGILSWNTRRSRARKLPSAVSRAPGWHSSKARPSQGEKRIIRLNDPHSTNRLIFNHFPIEVMQAVNIWLWHLSHLPMGIIVLVNI